MTTKIDLPTFGGMSAKEVVKAPFTFAKAWVYLNITLPVSLIDPVMVEIKQAAETALELTQDLNDAAAAAVQAMEDLCGIDRSKSREENIQKMTKIIKTWFK